MKPLYDIISVLTTNYRKGCITVSLPPCFYVVSPSRCDKIYLSTIISQRGEIL
nr:MAG TPA: hypothetical protein [Caudoviricetes sp.]